MFGDYEAIEERLKAIKRKYKIKGKMQPMDILNNIDEILDLNLKEIK